MRHEKGDLRWKLVNCARFIKIYLFLIEIRSKCHEGKVLTFFFSFLFFLQANSPMA